MPIQYIGTPQQLLVNPGFENTTFKVSRGEPWRLSNMNLTQFPTNIDPSASAHCGSQAIATGGDWLTYPMDGFMYQQVTIPATAPQPVLTPSAS